MAEASGKDFRKILYRSRRMLTFARLPTDPTFLNNKPFLESNKSFMLLDTHEQITVYTGVVHTVYGVCRRRDSFSRCLCCMPLYWPGSMGLSCVTVPRVDAKYVWTASRRTVSVDARRLLKPFQLRFLLLKYKILSDITSSRDWRHSLLPLWPWEWAGAVRSVEELVVLTWEWFWDVKDVLVAIMLLVFQSRLVFFRKDCGSAKLVSLKLLISTILLRNNLRFLFWRKLEFFRSSLEMQQIFLLLPSWLSWSTTFNRFQLPLESSCSYTKSRSRQNLDCSPGPSNWDESWVNMSTRWAMNVT